MNKSGSICEDGVGQIMSRWKREPVSLRRVVVSIHQSLGKMESEMKNKQHNGSKKRHHRLTKQTPTARQLEYNRASQASGALMFHKSDCDPKFTGVDLEN